MDYGEHNTSRARLLWLRRWPAADDRLRSSSDGDGSGSSGGGSGGNGGGRGRGRRGGVGGRRGAHGPAPERSAFGMVVCDESHYLKDFKARARVPGLATWSDAIACDEFCSSRKHTLKSLLP